MKIKVRVKNFWEKNCDWISIVLILIYSFLVWWPTRQLPYHWDSAVFVINSAKNFLETNFENLVNIGSEFAHPPLIPLTLALLWKIFGESFLVSHIFMFFFLPALMIGTYLIAKEFLRDKVLALLSSFLVGVCPFVLHELGLIYVDLPMAVFVVFGVYFLIKKKEIWSIIFLSLAVLTKIPAIIVLLVLIIDKLIKKEKFDKKDWILTIPFLILFIWLNYHKTQKGWMFSIPGRAKVNPTDFISLTVSIGTVFDFFFIHQGRFILSLLTLLSLYKLKIWKNWKKLEKISLPLILFFLGLGFYIAIGEFNFRYSIFVLPFFILISIYLINKSKVIKKEKLYWLLVLNIIVFVFFWHPKIEPKYEYEFRPYEDLSYQDMIKVFQKSGKFLEENYRQAKIYSAPYDEIIFGQNHHGYVEGGLNVKLCSDFWPDNKAKQIIVLHPYAYEQVKCRELLNSMLNKKRARFVEGGEWLEVYEIVK